MNKKNVILFMAVLVYSLAMSSLTACGGDDDDDNSQRPQEEQSDNNSPTVVKVPTDVIAVDLGLPSGTKWANMNVGAQKPEDYGLFFAWGETVGYDTSDKLIYNVFCNWFYYKWTNKIDPVDPNQTGWIDINKYQVDDGKNGIFKGCWYDSNGKFIGDGKNTLEPADDAASANWGGQWVMPTNEEILELLGNTTKEWITVNGVNGMKFTSKTNGNSIFLPTAGYRLLAPEPHNQSTLGYYWSSTVYPSWSADAYHLEISIGYFPGMTYSMSRFAGLTVRPVLRN